MHILFICGGATVSDTKCFILDIDASDSGLRAVLCQLDEEGAEHVVAYASHLL